MSNQANEDELRDILTELYYAESRLSGTGTDPGTSRGAQVRKAKQAILSIIRTEKLKLLAEARERVVGEDEKLHYINADADPDDYLVSERKARNALRAEQLEVLAKLEAEL